MGASPTLISQVNDYSWSHLWLVYLGTWGNIPKQLPKLPLFQGNYLASLVQHRLPGVPYWQENMASAPQKLMKSRTGNPFSAFRLNFHLYSLPLQSSHPHFFPSTLGCGLHNWLLDYPQCLRNHDSSLHCQKERGEQRASWEQSRRRHPATSLPPPLLGEISVTFFHDAPN